MNYHEITISGRQIKLIPLGDCACGCGGKTGISRQKRRGYAKGVPVRFISGHNSPKGKDNPAWLGRKIDSRGFPQIWRPDHPKASNGYISEYRYKAEKALGKPLPPKVVVHHYTPDQLVICQDQSYHFLLHQRQKAYENCGHADWLKCSYCQKYDKPENIYNQPGKRQSDHHKECRREHRRVIRLGSKLSANGEKVAR